MLGGRSGCDPRPHVGTHAQNVLLQQVFARSLCWCERLICERQLRKRTSLNIPLEESLEEIKQNTQILTLWHVIALYPRLHSSKPPKNSNYCRCRSDRGESSASMRDDKGDEREIAAAAAKSFSLSQPYPQLKHVAYIPVFYSTLQVKSLCRI